MPRRFAISNALAVVALLFGILLMHGLSTAAAHGAAHQHHDQPAVGLVPIAHEIAAADSGDSHVGHLLCLCVLIAAVAGVLLAAGLRASTRRLHSLRAEPLIQRRTSRAASHPPPRRKLALLSVALH